MPWGFNLQNLALRKVLREPTLAQMVDVQEAVKPSTSSM